MNYCNQCANYRFIVPHVQICLDCWNPCHICGQEKHKGLRCPIIKTPEYKMRGSLEEKKKKNILHEIPENMKYMKDESTFQHIIYVLTDDKKIKEKHIFDTIDEVNTYLSNPPPPYN